MNKAQLKETVIETRNEISMKMHDIKKSPDFRQYDDIVIGNMTGARYCQLYSHERYLCYLLLNLDDFDDHKRELSCKYVESIVREVQQI